MNPISLNKKLWIIMLIVLLILFLTTIIVGYFIKIFVYIIIAFLISYLMIPIIKKLEDEGIHTRYALSFVLIGFLFIIFVFFYLITPIIVYEVDSIIKEWPEASKRINEEVLTQKNTNGSTVYYSPLLKTEINAAKINKAQEKIDLFITNFFTFSLEIIYAIIIIPVLVIIIIKEGYKIKKEFYSLIPNKYFEIVISIVEGIYESIGKFSKAKIIQSGIVAGVAIIGFILIDLRGAIILGIIAGILNIIPYLGPLISLIPITLISYLFHDLKTTILALSIIGIAQLIDNLITQPIIIPKMIKEHPLTVIILILIGSKLYGPLGMVIAIPLYSILRIVFSRVYRGLEVLYSREEET